jgi:hypothetical protein
MEEIYYRNITILQDKINNKVKKRIETLSYRLIGILEEELPELNIGSEGRKKSNEIREDIVKGLMLKISAKLIETECEKLINK